MKVCGIYSEIFFKKCPWFMPVKLWNVVCQRANPRSFEYMSSLFNRYYPNGKLVEIADIVNFEKVVLLYPDSIGLGYKKLENILLNRKQVFALNGRSRHFELVGTICYRLYIRRFLEITFLSEIGFAPVLIVFSIFLALFDKLRGTQ